MSPDEEEISSNGYETTFKSDMICKQCCSQSNQAGFLCESFRLLIQNLTIPKQLNVSNTQIHFWDEPICQTVVDSSVSMEVQCNQIDIKNMQNFLIALYFN